VARNVSDHALQWLELCRECRALKQAHDQLFWENVAKFTTHFGGSTPAGPTVEEIAREDRAREAVEDCRDRLMKFVAEHT
jgi:hypothetical protein